MKLRKVTTIGVALALGCAIVGLGFGHSEDTNAVPSQTLMKPHLKELNSMYGMLFELAAERHAAHSKGSRVWVFTFHRESNEVQKYSDGKYVIVSLPAELEENERGLCVYVGQYNSLTACHMDELARKGRYVDALKYYDILLHFERCEGFGRENAQKKRDYLAKIVRNEDPDENKRKYFELCIPVAGHLNLSEIETMKPTTVTNLMTLEIR